MTDALKIESVGLRYGDLTVLSGVDLSVARGELLGLVGPNGSGKTSLIRAILGLQSLSAGRIVVDGIDIAQDPRAARARLGFAPDPSSLPGYLTLGQALAVAAAAREQEVDDRLRAFGETLQLAPFWDRRIEVLSLGTRQKLAILVALIGDPPLLILDEVLNGLDPIAAFEVKNELKRRCERGSAVLLATHGLETAPTLLTRAALLARGRIAQTWGPDVLDGWRHQDPAAFERAVVETLRDMRDFRPG
jgi:ABC-2 type transport system ATP-binding protein